MNLTYVRHLDLYRKNCDVMWHKLYNYATRSYEVTLHVLSVSDTNTYLFKYNPDFSLRWSRKEKSGSTFADESVGRPQRSSDCAVLVHGGSDEKTNTRANARVHRDKDCVELDGSKEYRHLRWINQSLVLGVELDENRHKAAAWRANTGMQLASDLTLVDWDETESQQLYYHEHLNILCLVSLNAPSSVYDSKEFITSLLSKGMIPREIEGESAMEATFGANDIVFLDNEDTCIASRFVTDEKLGFERGWPGVETNADGYRYTNIKLVKKLVRRLEKLYTFTSRTSVSVSPNGRKVAVTDDSKLIVLCAESGNELWNLEIPVDAFCVKWSPSGKHIAISGDRLVVVDAVEGKVDCERTLPFAKGTRAYASVKWHPMELHLAVYGHDGVVVFDTDVEREEPQPLPPAAVEPDPIGDPSDKFDGKSRLRWSPDGKHAALYGEGSIVSLLEWQSRRLLWEVSSPKSPAEHTLQVWSPDSSKFVLWAQSESDARVYGLDGVETRLQTLTVFDSIAWLDNRRLVGVSSHCAEALLWNADTGEILHSIPLPFESTPCQHIALHAESGKLAVFTDKRFAVVSLFDSLDQNVAVFQSKDFQNAAKVFTAAWADDTLLVTTKGRQIAYTDSLEIKWVVKDDSFGLQEGNHRLRMAAVSPCNSMVVTLINWGQVLRVSDGSLIAKIDIPYGSDNWWGLSWSPDGKWVAVDGDAASIIDMQSHEVHCTFCWAGSNGTQWHPSSEYVAVEHADCGSKELNSVLVYAVAGMEKEETNESE